MALVVNNNLTASNAHRYMKLNDASYSKAVERLSSGMKINRASDDPAGLVISEKFRAQVDGLNQAIKNAQDGISLVQTAEGALDEVTTVLRNMRNLALHAANTGSSDTSAIAADQDQMQQAISTLDRIASTTAFGNRKLLDGTSGATASVTDASNIKFMSGSSATKEGSYALSISQVATKGVSTSTAAKTIANTSSAFGAAQDLGAETGTLHIKGALTGNTDVTVDLTGDGTDIDDVVNAINANTTLAGYGITAEKNGANFIIKSADISAAGAGELKVWATGSDAATRDELLTLTGLAGTAVDEANAVASTTATATSAAKITSDETLTFRNGATYVQVGLKDGDTISSAISKMQSALDSAGINVTVAFDSTNGTIKLTNDEYGGANTVKVTVESDQNAAIGNSGLAAATGTAYSVASGFGVGGGAKATGYDVAGTIGGFAATGSGQFLTGATSTDVEGLKLKILGSTTGTVNVTQNALKFQIGALQNQTVAVALSDVRTNMLGNTASGTTTMTDINVASIDLTTGDGAGAQDAIMVLDAAISQVSTMRATLGSFQKDVLESTSRNLAVAAQNMSSSESAIRDADMAEEMLNFSRAQILQQTGVSMLAQANQAPQQIMKLFS